MAEMIASAVVGETVGRISTILIDKPDTKPSKRDELERLEMAHIKLEAALHMSKRWQITQVPMLRWRSKLKRAAQECDDTLRRCKQRALELEEEEIRRQRSSFPRRITHAAKSLIMSSFSSSNNTSCVTVDDVRRFERFADGTGEFLKFVEFGRRPYTFFNPLIGDLLAGKILRYRALQGGKFHYLFIRATSFEERGVETMVWFVYQDFKEPAKSLNLGLMMRLSESSDIFGIIIKCMQSATPHFTVAAQGVRRELIGLPTQDFCWLTNSPFRENEYWVHVHITLTQWLRPDPLCCSYRHQAPSSSTNSSASIAPSTRLACMYPEEVIVVYLQYHILPPDQLRSRQNFSATRDSGSADPLKLGVLFIPHDSTEDIEAASESYAFEVIDGKEQETLHINASLQDVDEKLLPKAVDHLCQDSESKIYQMCLRSKHGTAHLCVEKTTQAARVPSTGKNRTLKSASRVQNKRIEKKKKREDHGSNMDGWLDVSKDLLKYWVVCASDKLHGSIKSWIVNSPKCTYSLP
ncbi:uncharacterized protein LOC100827810 [Brachypodium distachyon]|uniref:Uncharacterized protein n=1 Tax=Brachypodium distachyon TaxID=15368 RepID=A0A0Q3ERA3_BRADI|nr:uncharacterized protein LOC100827810 [Brachypodium distachyon]XP_024318570.1 uncharacterized protein LOC100827810 [Brachypodium distachyon]KQJ89967.2 hypothetical protein BRADI_4g28964v3 [Brachypodium distachyon]KQJ90012.1 hypothetical protein BRADI_4g28964v3 [Brachypodium distachyon]|eukprot:XP_003576465.1 uncharacterized protein LOC100827810 [Brachypodium distachyon]